MCGRFVLLNSGETIADQFNLPFPPAVEPRYNIAPTQPVAGIRLNDKGEREFAHFHWGLIPFWAKDAKMAGRMINARSETVAEKPSFRAAYKYRRCLVPASGFYEWQPQNGKKQPFYIHHIEDDILGIAGIYERWSSPDGGEIESVSLLTTTPNNFMKPIHNRMPVIIEPEDYGVWLDPKADPKRELPHLLRPYRDGSLTAYPVSTTVNYAGNDVPACIEPI